MQNNENHTEGKKMIISKNDENSVQITANILKNNGIAILPTDTVYGFSASVNLSTDKKIRKIKGREENKPFIQLIAEPKDIFDYTDDFIPPEILAKWPGALTIIVHNKESCDNSKTTAFRCPKDSWLRTIIESCGFPIFSTSVNKSGSSILETPQSIIETFGNCVDLIVDDGEKKGALPSTLIKLENGKVQVIRQGEVVI